MRFRSVPIVSALTLILASIALADSDDPRLKGYRVPPGWKLEIVATEPLVINPVTMTWGPDGRLYVIEWQAGRTPNDHIKVLTDTDNDGIFDSAEMYMDGLDLPAGLCFWDGWAYVTLDHDVVRFRDKDNDGKFESKEVIVTGFGNDNSHHRVSGMTIGPDGWLYLTTGDSDARAKGSDGSEATVLRSGGVFRCTPEGKNLEVVAFGMRNPWGNVAFDDEFRIFHTDNDNEGSPGFTGCRLLHVVDGGDYGWRLREGARCCNPDFERATWDGGRPGRLGWMTETGRGAPAGLCVLNSAAFPPSTRNLLVYPDVFRKNVRAYKLKPEGATFKVAEEFELLAADEGLFRPTDAEIGPDGALYILDWRTDSGGAGQLSGNGQTGRIYRMTWAGTDQEPARPPFPPDRLVKAVREDDAALIAHLSSDDYGLRRAAGLELIRRGVTEPRAFAKVLVGSQTPALPRLHALAILQSKSPNRPAALSVRHRFCRDKDPALSRVALDFDSRFGKSDDVAWAEELLSTRFVGGIKQPEALRSFAMALGRLNGLPRSRPGQNVDFGVFIKHNVNELGIEKKPKNDLSNERRQEIVDMTHRSISSDMIVQSLLDLADDVSEDDAFLRDGITRGIERLGQAGIDALLNSVATEGPKRISVALYTLEGLRTKGAVTAVLSQATGRDHLPASARAGLFRTLRELVANVRPEPIVEWLRDNPTADPAARVEAIRVLTAMQMRAIPSAAPILTSLLKNNHEEVRKAALLLAGNVHSDDARSALLEIVKNADRKVDERRFALSALRSYEEKQLVSELQTLFGTSTDAGFLGELLRTVASLDFTAAATQAEKLLSSTDTAVRHEAIRLLGQKPETALLVAKLYNDNKLPAEDLASVIEAVRPHASPELQAATQQLLKNKLLAAPTRDEARHLREFVTRRGNAERGKIIYLDAKKGGCATCHRLEGSGGSVGPDLTRIWETLSFDKRVESILDPSKEIKEGFTTFKVATKNGQVLTGLLVENTPEAVTLKDAQGREVKIPSAEIDEKGADPVSLMPAGVVGHLSFEELADLLSFLGNRAAQESLRAK